MTTFRAAGKADQSNSAAILNLTCAISAGDSVVVVGSWDAASTATPAVITTGGTGSDTAALIYGPFTSGSFKYAGWLLQSASAARTGMRLTWSGSIPTFADAFCESFFGITNPVVDQAKFAAGSGTVVTSGFTATLSSSSDFAISYAASANAIQSVNSPWVSDGITTTTRSGAGHQVLASNAPVASNFTNNLGAWITFVLTFSSVVAAQVGRHLPAMRQYMRAPAVVPPPQAPVVNPASFNLTVPAASGSIVGTMTASGSPTSWAITAGNASGFFAISNTGVITVTAAGASGLVAGNYSLTCSATNANGSGSGVATVTASQASGAWPNAATTGVPAGTTLTPVSGNFFSSSAGQVINALDVSGTISVNHTGVTIQNCRASAIRFGDTVASHNFIVKDCTVSASGGNGIWAIIGHNGQILRCNISGFENFIVLSDGDACLIQDNWFNNPLPGSPSTAHTDGVQIFPGNTNVNIVHNFFDFPVAGINSNVTTNDVTNITIDNCKMQCQNYCVYWEGNTTGCVVKNSMLDRAGATSGGGYIAGTAAFGQTYTNNTKWDGTPLSLP